MSILNRKRKRHTKEDSGLQLVGLLLPDQLASYLNIHCLAKGVSKTLVIRELIENWADEQLSQKSKDDLIKEVAHRAYESWKYPKTTIKRENFNTFLKRVRIELKIKKLDSYVDEIINLISDEKKNDKEI